MFIYFLLNSKQYSLETENIKTAVFFTTRGNFQVLKLRYSDVRKQKKTPPRLHLSMETFLLRTFPGVYVFPPLIFSREKCKTQSIIHEHDFLSKESQMRKGKLCFVENFSSEKIFYLQSLKLNGFLSPSFNQ